MVTQLTGTTTLSGIANTSKAPSGPFLYGPYLLSIPANPFNNDPNIVYSTDFATDVDVVDSGWLYNRTTGEIRLNYSGTDEDGIAYIDY